jgi:hypothetical protein
VTGTDIDYEMSWAKVQRRVAQLIKEDRFYTQEEYDRLDDIDPVYIRAELAQRGIVNGELVEPEKLDNDPFIQQVNADVKSLSESVEAWEAEQEAKRNEAIARLTDEQQTIVEAMNVAGYVYQHNVGYSGEPIVFYANTDSYPISFANWNDAYDWIDNAELKLEPGLRDKVQAVLHPDEPPRMTDAEFAAEHLVPRESTYEIDGRRFIVDSVNLDFGSVSLQDVTFQNQTGFPIFRSESIEFMRRLVEISEAQRTAELPAEPTSAEPKPELHNFQITDDHLGEGGAKAKFRMNMDAINLLKELEFDGRQATPEEQVILSKYVGWGGLADAFDETKDNWKNEFAELYATLSPEEYAAARSSTLNAHFTSPTVIKAIYEAVGNMGFETGNILEPSMGVGNFFGCLPRSDAEQQALRRGTGQHHRANCKTALPQGRHYYRRL